MYIVGEQIIDANDAQNELVQTFNVIIDANNDYLNIGDTKILCLKPAGYSGKVRVCSHWVSSV